MLLKRGGGIEGETRNIHLEVVNQYGISLGGRMTSAAFTFPPVSLEMVAMITRCPQLKICDMWIAAFILSHLPFINCFSSAHTLFLMQQICSYFFKPLYILYEQNAAILPVPLQILSLGL